MVQAGRTLPGQITVQITAEGNIDQLKSAADPEEGKIIIYDLMQKIYFEPVPLIVDALREFNVRIPVK